MDVPYPRNSENCLILSRFPDSFLYKIHCVTENPSYLKLARSKTPIVFIIQYNPSSRRKIDHQEKSTLASLVPWRPGKIILEEPYLQTLDIQRDSNNSGHKLTSFSCQKTVV